MFAKGTVIDEFASATGTSGLKYGKSSAFVQYSFQGMLCSSAKSIIHQIAMGIRHHTVYDFCRHSWGRQAAHLLRADRHDVMAFHKVQHFLAAVVATVVFAVSPEQAGTYGNFHA